MRERQKATDGQSASTSKEQSISANSQVRGIFGNTEALALQSLRLRREVDKLKNELRKMHELSRQELYDDVEGFINVSSRGSRSRRGSAPANTHRPPHRQRSSAYGRTASRPKGNSLHNLIRNFPRWSSRGIRANLSGSKQQQGVAPIMEPREAWKRRNSHT